MGAYAHPLSYLLGYKEGDVLSSQGGYLRNTQHLIAPKATQVQDIRAEEDLHVEEKKKSTDDEELPYLLLQALNENDTTTTGGGCCSSSSSSEGEAPTTTCPPPPPPPKPLTDI